MEIFVKTLTGIETTLQIEPDWPLSRLKEEIEAHVNIQAKFMVLVANQEILTDDSVKVKDTGIAKVGFVVAMMSKRKMKSYCQKNQELPAEISNQSVNPPGESSAIGSPDARADGAQQQQSAELVPTSEAAPTSEPARNCDGLYQPATTSQATQASAQTDQPLLFINVEGELSGALINPSSQGDQAAIREFLEDVARRTGELPQNPAPNGSSNLGRRLPTIPLDNLSEIVQDLMNNTISNIEQDVANSAAPSSSEPNSAVQATLEIQGESEDEEEDEDVGEEDSNAPFLEELVKDQPLRNKLYGFVDNPNFPLLQHGLTQNPAFFDQFMQQLATQEPEVHTAFQNDTRILEALLNFRYLDVRTRLRNQRQRLREYQARLEGGEQSRRRERRRREQGQQAQQDQSAQEQANNQQSEEPVEAQGCEEQQVQSAQRQRAHHQRDTRDRSVRLIEYGWTSLLTKNFEQEEVNAVQRIIDMKFNYHPIQVSAVYMICEKKQEETVNFLLGTSSEEFTLEHSRVVLCDQFKWDPNLVQLAINGEGEYPEDFFDDSESEDSQYISERQSSSDPLLQQSSSMLEISEEPHALSDEDEQARPSQLQPEAQPEQAQAVLPFASVERASNPQPSSGLEIPVEVPPVLNEQEAVAEAGSRPPENSDLQIDPSQAIQSLRAALNLNADPVRQLTHAEVIDEILRLSREIKGLKEVAEKEEQNLQNQPENLPEVPSPVEILPNLEEQEPPASTSPPEELTSNKAESQQEPSRDDINAEAVPQDEDGELVPFGTLAQNASRPSCQAVEAEDQKEAAQIPQGAQDDVEMKPEDEELPSQVEEQQVSSEEIATVVQGERLEEAPVVDCPPLVEAGSPEEPALADPKEYPGGDPVGQEDPVVTVKTVSTPSSSGSDPAQEADQQIEEIVNSLCEETAAEKVEQAEASFQDNAQKQTSREPIAEKTEAKPEKLPPALDIKEAEAELQPSLMESVLAVESRLSQPTSEKEPVAQSITKPKVSKEISQMNQKNPSSTPAAPTTSAANPVKTKPTVAPSSTSSSAPAATDSQSRQVCRTSASPQRHSHQQAQMEEERTLISYAFDQAIEIIQELNLHKAGNPPEPIPQRQKIPQAAPQPKQVPQKKLVQEDVEMHEDSDDDWCEGNVKDSLSPPREAGVPADSQVKLLWSPVQAAKEEQEAEKRSNSSKSSPTSKAPASPKKKPAYSERLPLPEKVPDEKLQVLKEADTPILTTAGLFETEDVKTTKTDTKDGWFSSQSTDSGCKDDDFYDPDEATEGA